jgi:hypothetical protein
VTRPVRFAHGLAGHDIVNRDGLSAIIDRLDADDIEHHVGDLPLVLPDGIPPRLPLGATEVARDLEHNRCWILLSHLQRYPAAGPLCAVVRGEIAPHLAATERAERRIVGTDVTGLLGAPGALVPVHFDNHHVFLFQIAGTKTVHVGWYDDPTVAQRAIERNLLPPSLNPTSLPETTEEFELGPGDGLAIPPLTFHWVVGGEGVSVAVSVAVRTPATEHMLGVHIANASLRRFGLRPGLPGRHAGRDRVKAWALNAHNRVRRRHVRA